MAIAFTKNDDINYETKGKLKQKQKPNGRASAFAICNHTLLLRAAKSLHQNNY